MKTEKGQYGYRRKNFLMRLSVTAVLAAAIAAQLAARCFADTQAARSILTVMAILTVLPMANMAAPLLASFPYRTPPAEFYARTEPYEERFLILYDLIVTTKEQVIPLDAAAVHPFGIYAYCPSEKLDADRAQRGINAILADNRLDLKIRILQDEKAFFKRLDSLKPAAGCPDDGSAEYAAGVLKAISM